MEEHFGKIKAGVVALAALVSARLGVLAVPLALLVACNLADYVTGIVAAPSRGEARSSKSGFAGIAKKIAMWLLVAVGAVVDILLVYFTSPQGSVRPISFVVASLVCIWLLANEVISIIENLADMGVHIPPFLLPLVQWVKQKAESGAQQALPENKDDSPEDEGGQGRP